MVSETNHILDMKTVHPLVPACVFLVKGEKKWKTGIIDLQCRYTLITSWGHARAGRGPKMTASLHCFLLSAAANCRHCFDLIDDPLKQVSVDPALVATTNYQTKLSDDRDEECMCGTVRAWPSILGLV